MFRLNIPHTQGIHVRFNPCDLRNPNLSSNNSNTGPKLLFKDVSQGVEPTDLLGMNGFHRHILKK